MKRSLINLKENPKFAIPKTLHYKVLNRDDIWSEKINQVCTTHCVAV